MLEALAVRDEVERVIVLDDRIEHAFELGVERGLTAGERDLFGAVEAFALGQHLADEARAAGLWVSDRDRAGNACSRAGSDR